MKIVIGFIVSLLLVQAFAFPSSQAVEDPEKPEHAPTNEIVDQFRQDLLTKFARFQAFYDLFTDQMTRYRLSHVDLVSEIGLLLMEVFSVDIDAIRVSKDSVDGEVRNALDRLGGSPNACLQDVIDNLDANSARLGREFNACTRRANATIGNGLSNVFYPTFDNIQNQASLVPLLTISALSRGNVFEEPQEIIDYLDAQYQVIVLQWKSAASQLFRWETNRFDVEGRFYVEEMHACLLGPTENYINTNTFQMFRIVDECSPVQQ